MSTTENTEQDSPVEPDPIPVFDEGKAPKVKPRFLVAGTTFFAQTEEGELAIPLRFKTKLIRSIRDIPGDEIDQMFALLDGLGDRHTADALDELDVFETMEIVGAFFRAWQEKQQASVGEARRSSS